jgi:hypothetical protein
MSRQALYTWLDQAEVAEEQAAKPAVDREGAELRQQIARLKRLLADKTLEVDFFKGAFETIEARRRNSSGSGGTASGSISGK